MPISKIITYFASQNKKQSARATLLRNLQCSSLGLYRKKHKRAMKDKYIDLIEQTFDFPQDEFTVEDNELNFHDIPLMELIKQYGTPLKITYLPKISQQINRAKRMFNVAMAKVDYKGTYNYCYCTKSSHFSFVLEEAMKNDIHLETSSAYDIHIINALYDSGVIDKDRYIICNGFKRPQYVENIAQLINDGFENTIPVIDNKEEIDLYDDAITQKCKIGIRIASEEEPKFEFYTSRLGIRYNDIINFYKTKIQKNKKFKLKMLHFFINTGIKDTAYYWNELSKCLNIYCELKAICPDLDSLNIGGGFPIKNSLDFSYDYEYLTEEIIAQIKNICTRNGIDEPHIFTEFGSFTVGESGATLYSIVNQKQQNDRENWYMIDSSFITTLPDTWGINQRYIMLAINNWDKEYQRVLLGGLTCDSEDFYNSESHINAIFLPKLEPGNPQYIGFFHTGAYQESIGGFGGIQHCLIPAPKHVIIDRDKEDNEYYTRLFAKEQSYRSMLRILGIDGNGFSDRKFRNVRHRYESTGFLQREAGAILMPVLIQPRKRTQLHDPIFLSPQVIRHPEPRNIGIRRIIIKGFNLTEYVRCFIPSLTKILQENCLFIIIHVELCPPVIQIQGIARCYFVIHLAIDTGA